MPEGILNPAGMAVKEVQARQQEERKELPAVVIPEGILNPTGMEVRLVQPYQQA